MPHVIPLTANAGGHILTNSNVWSPDGNWIVYDIRSDIAGECFDGNRIEAINISTQEVRILYESREGARCGVASWHPRRTEVVFILGPESPTHAWSYGAARRQGVMVRWDQPGIAANLDARNLVPPFTPGALRGGSHLHIFSPCGERVSFTYEDQYCLETGSNHAGLRDVGICLPSKPVRVSKSHPRNHDGSAFSVLVTRSVPEPTPGSDEYSRACEEAWIGNAGYRRTDGTQQRWALAFQGHVRAASGATFAEVFVVDLPDDITTEGQEPLAGSVERPPSPPRGVVCRRVTHTDPAPFPGLRGPRHWLKSSPNGSRIGFLRCDERGVVQFWTVPTAGGSAVQATRNSHPIASCFTWHPGGQRVAFVMDNSVCETDVESGETRRITPRSQDEYAPRPEACVYSPDGEKIAFVRRLPTAHAWFNQICVVELDR